MLTRFLRELKRQWTEEKAWQVLLGSLIIGIMLGYVLVMIGAM